MHWVIQKEGIKRKERKWALELILEGVGSLTRKYYRYDKFCNVNVNKYYGITNE